ncbi:MULTISPECIES: DegV family protein [Prauserella salsuginis group]|uniref:DegV family protein with EDD domain n=2 Tax=Prauserella salsuginis group TaxID=2893672 RepID=A0A839XK93_9PSEU|nr:MULTISPECIES: DegV family protein [Prauserella salsuginis group]MBB3661108.1 DegV family protein with EDD domain [Prauserella sediminis]MCR3718973.1 EDD domain protein, DegV family [Prauserella flava]MCR3733543.1 EDD domain protein, DegV family [Prauserella salsuginis]
MPVAVVTDSTAHLPEGCAERLGIRVVPLHVLVDGLAVPVEEFGAEELTGALRRKRIVTTSRPTPTEFAAQFRAALDAGADSVVSVHLSKRLSGTWEAAVLAAQEVGPDRVRVVDSRTTAMGLGFAASHAAAAAQAGLTGAEVEDAATATALRSRTLFVVETLEHLRRGGRIGHAAALLGTALMVKPVLHMAEGEITPLEKVRTTGRAMARLVELAAEAAAGEPDVEVAVHHLAAPDRAAELATRLDERLPASRGCVVTELGAVIGAHTGPGVLGVVVQRPTPRQ